MSIEIHPYITTNGLLTQLNFTNEQVENNHFQNGGIWFKNTRTIICGTFPPTREYKNRKGYIHYSSPRNKFWKHVDNIYRENLYIPSKVSNNEFLRIKNSLNKISFLKQRGLGFVDIFTKISRIKECSTRDTDIIPEETIFDNQIFDTIIQQSEVKQIAFVYSLSKKIFEDKLLRIFGKRPKIIREYNTAQIPLEVKTITINQKDLFLSYSPIHGKILDEQKRIALKKVTELDLLT